MNRDERNALLGFVVRLARESHKDDSILTDTAIELIEIAQQYQNVVYALRNGRWGGEAACDMHFAILEVEAQNALASLGNDFGIEFSRDPGDSPIKVMLPSGRYNDPTSTGWLVPMSI